MHPEPEPAQQDRGGRREPGGLGALAGTGLGAWTRARWLWLVATAALCLAAALPAQAQPRRLAAAASTANYKTDTIGAVRWTYPVSASAEVRALQAYEGDAWRSVVTELGAPVTHDLDIRVALNPEQMQGLAPPGSPLPGYADGIAFPAQGLILLTLTEPETWLRPDMRALLRHELSHVALHRAVSGAVLPRWFSEGVAVHQAGESTFTRVKTLWDGTLRGRLMSLEQISVSFPQRHSEVDLAYAQSSDFVGFLLGGADERTRFHALLGGLARHVAFGEAIKQAYHVPLEYLEREWRNTLTQRFGRWPALLMGLTFVWVLGALLLVAAYIRSRRKHKLTLRRWAIEEAPLLQPLAAVPPPPQSPHLAVLEDFFEHRSSDEPGIPTVVHEGHNHTLH